jgi:hypothetical protein
MDVTDLFAEFDNVGYLFLSEVCLDTQVELNR